MKKITKLNELKQIELEMLKTIHNICEENNLTYFLGYGTLLGAIRHQGFIPWDDDIDIMMPRPDYDILCKNFKELFENTDLQLAINDKNHIYYPRPFAKIINSKTILKETNYDDNNEIGVFIDVFFIDGTPKNKIIKKIHQTRCNFYRKLYYASILKKGVCKNKFMQIVSTIAHHLNKDKLLNKIDKICRYYDYNESQIVSNVLQMKNSEINKKWLTKKLIKFEGIDAYIPCGYDNILSDIYGDYMTPPPIEKQKPTHLSEIYWKD